MPKRFASSTGSSCWRESSTRFAGQRTLVFARVPGGTSGPTSASTRQIARCVPWVDDAKVGAKPDHLIKRRARYCKVTVDSAGGMLTRFPIELFVAREQQEEHNVCVQSIRGDNMMFFHLQGGWDVGVSTQRLCDLCFRATRPSLKNMLLRRCWDLCSGSLRLWHFASRHAITA
mmetsp:Transcript_72862/g.167277  ORF Transcript_72862/g.167277 Transcript_72862/m.167277 type:complete len:174 (+) Transcript_72862:135-656(+)